jgi:hypothetical protein
MSNQLERFELWWQGKLTGLPLMYVQAHKETGAPAMERPGTPEAYYTDMDYLLRRYRESAGNDLFLADAYASFSADLGPGSLALYLGSDPIFSWDTVWYKESIGDLAGRPLAYDPENKWWKLHREMLTRAKNASGGSFRVDIPDLIEGIDIFFAMRGTEQSLYDLIDDPELVSERVRQIDDVYFRYYDALYDLLKESDGSGSYTCFHIMGRGRVAKIQCDVSAMMSPAQYREFALPSLVKQTERLDRSLYHLDGPDAIRHVPAIMEINKLNALQWTCGAGQPDGACPRWFPIYDSVATAGKSLWIQLYDGNVQDWIISAERLMARYGKQSLYFNFPVMTEKEAETLLTRAETRWK